MDEYNDTYMNITDKILHTLRNNRFTLLSCFLGMSAFLPFDSEAKIARKDPFTIIQPDGRELTVTLHGDEKCHYLLSSDGYLLMGDRKNGYFYASYLPDGTPYPSSLIASDSDSRSGTVNDFLSSISETDRDKAIEIMMKNTKDMVPFSTRRSQSTRGLGLFSTNFPVFGEQKSIVILVEYSDVKFDLRENAHDYFNNMLNQENFSEYGATGSARDWFIANSNGQFLPQFDLYGPVTLSKRRDYYGGNDRYGEDKYPEEMVIEACQLLDDEVDFTQYDRDHDGYIDNVYVFYAGQGEADGGGDDTVWPHSWEIVGGTGKMISLDGVVLDHYACSNETDHYTKRPDGIGTFIHEFSHVMGLPDLYATEQSSAFTPGSFSVLDYGPYNNDGRTPPNYSAFELNALGWITPEIPEKSGYYSLPPISREKKVLMLPTQKDSEFFLLENRQMEGNDKYIPGHGMLVWQIDYDKDIWDANVVNNNSSHQYVDLIEADNIRSEFTRKGDPFPGNWNVRSLSSSTIPSLVNWDNKSIGFALSEITEDSDNISLYIENTNNWAAVDEIEAGKVDLKIVNGEILCSHKAVVYDINGKMIGEVDQYSSLQLVNKGIYLVKIGNKTHKLIF